MHPSWEVSSGTVPWFLSGLSLPPFRPSLFSEQNRLDWSASRPSFVYSLLDPAVVNPRWIGAFIERRVIGVLIELSIGVATASLTLVELLTCILVLLIYQPPSIFAVNFRFSNA
mmetsp:Transcript_7071/g.9172  ORF Transcript_7071/g.9172 Transcript_7071/m.9172 type:complete len:114 (-) Transcript_7071:1002-1343(-)